MLVVVAFFLIVAAWYLWERSHRRTHAMAGGLHADVALPHEREWELYHNALSLCSKKARVCLAELGVDYKAHHVDLIETGRYENISRHFLAVNPAGLVPVLVHNGHPVYESHDQIAYAAEHASGAQLVPASAGERERMQVWVNRASLFGDDPTQDMNLSAGNCIPGLTVPLFSAMVHDIPYWKIFEGLLFHRLKMRPLLFAFMKMQGLERIGKNARVRLVVHKSREYMHEHLDDLEKQLASSGGPWILGECYSLADVSWTVIFERLREADWLAVFVNETRPHAAAYWERLRARPSYARAIGEFAHPAVERGMARLIETKKTNAALRQLYGD